MEKDAEYAVQLVNSMNPPPPANSVQASATGSKGKITTGGIFNLFPSIAKPAVSRAKPAMTVPVPAFAVSLVPWPAPAPASVPVTAPALVPTTVFTANDPKVAYLTNTVAAAWTLRVVSLLQTLLMSILFDEEA